MGFIERSPEILVGAFGATGDTENHDALIIIQDRIDDAPITNADAMGLPLEFFHPHRPRLIPQRPDDRINMLKDVVGQAA